MNYYKIICTFISIAGCIVIFGWMLVDIYGTEKLSPIFAVIGLLCVVFGEMKLNHIQIMEKLNESKAT